MQYFNCECLGGRVQFDDVPYEDIEDIDLLKYTLDRAKVENKFGKLEFYCTDCGKLIATADATMFINSEIE